MTQSNKANQSADDLKAEARDLGKGVRRAGEDLKDGVSDAARHAGDAMENARDSAGRGSSGMGSGGMGGMDMDQAGDMLQERREQIETMVRDRPLVSLLAAFAVGYIIAKLR